MATLKSIYTPPTKASSDEEWLKWYDELSGFGKKKADLAFARAWAARGGVSSKANTSNFRDVMLKNGFNIDGGVFSNALDEKRRLLNSFTDFFKMGALGTSVIMVVIVIMVLIIIYKNFSSPGSIQKIADSNAKTASSVAKIAI